jgi:geranylgeranyl diphosphate synthase, type I
MNATVAISSDFHSENLTMEEYLKMVDIHLQPYMLRAIKNIPNVSPLREGVQFQIDTGGKRLRAALCVTSCDMFCGSIMRAMNFAAAIEHLQNFMLDHDDIADEDEERRARESIWKKYGIAHGLNIGNAFISLAAQAILSSPYSNDLKIQLLGLVSMYGLQIADGQSRDLNLKANDSPTLEEYYNCTQKKTGAFLALAAVGGAVIGGADPAATRYLDQFALKAGVAFQVKDDLIDVNGIKGRARGSDIMEGKRTLIAIYVADKCTRTERRRLFRILNKPRAATNTDDIAWVLSLYHSYNATDYAEAVAIKLIDEALVQLDYLPDSEAKQMLARISNFITLRIR